MLPHRMIPFLLACSSTLAVVEKHPRDSGDVDTGDTGDTADTSDTEPVPVDYDCEALPSAPVEDNELTAPRGYHDVLISNDGYAYGFDGNSIVRSTYEGPLEVFLPRAGNIQQMDWLPDGDMVVGDDFAQDLKRIDSTGASSVIASGLGAVYGVVTGPDEHVWVANGRSIYRVDPTTGDATEWSRLGRGVQGHSLAFKPGDSRLYIGSVGTGVVYTVAFDENYARTGEPEEYVKIDGSGWHDGVAFDACGNLFVADYYTSGLYRVAPDLTVTTFFRGRQRAYGHGIEWGNGVGGWRADALYLPQPYDNNTVREVVIGVPSAWSVQ